MMLTSLRNKKQIDTVVEDLTVSLGQAIDRYDRIALLAARLPRYFSLLTDKPVEYFEKWVERNPKKIEIIERTMHNDPYYLRNAWVEMDKLFSGA
jgi:hypothetical protein